MYFISTINKEQLNSIKEQLKITPFTKRIAMKAIQSASVGNELITDDEHSYVSASFE